MILRRIGEHVPIVRPREADRLAPPAAFDLNGRQEFLQKGQEHRAPESVEIASLTVRVAGFINRGQSGLAGQCIAEVDRRRMEAGPAIELSALPFSVCASSSGWKTRSPSGQK